MIEPVARASGDAPLYLKKNLAVLEQLIAHGGFGEIWRARIVNPIQLLAERVLWGEESPRILGIEDIPFEEARDEKGEWTPKPLSDPGHIRKVYAASDALWKEYEERRERDPARAWEERRNILELLDESLLKSPHIAVKVLKPALSREADKELDTMVRQQCEQRFYKENLMLRKLRHPSIVRRFGLVHDAAIGWCLLLEYIEGTNLEEHVKQREDHRLPPDEALLIGGCIAEGLAYCHGQGVIHRDLKPANVLMSKDGRVVITDFGIGKWADESATQQMTIPGARVGTPRYMAPEQVLGEPTSERTDMYQLGTLLFELVTGGWAYQQDQTGIFTMLSQMDLPHPAYVRELRPEISRELATLIEVARAKRAEDRWTTDEFLREAESIRAQKRYAAPEPAPRPSNASELKAELDLTIRERKKLRWKEQEVGTQLHYVSYSKSIEETRRLLASKEYGKARSLVEWLAKEIGPRSDSRYGPLKEEIARLELDVEVATGHAAVVKLLEAARERQAARDYPGLGEALALAETHLKALSEENHPDVWLAFRKLRAEYGPHKPFVEVFNTVHASFLVKIAEGLKQLDDARRDGRTVDARRVDELVEVVATARKMLETIEGDKVGSPYAATLTRLQEQHDVLRLLRAQAGPA